ncbi:hypothetical protein Cadr_000021392 [Camelus dromedarius]|uniref:Uncharacterized protein n=1 Tax=Camelus dromedarius TaxID=9838 RepID=A0A5N4CVL0_CAMDR|nr:hypothetical protein Cadr_000021392 [Camelus dromedarius]
MRPAIPGHPQHQEADRETHGALAEPMPATARLFTGLVVITGVKGQSMAGSLWVLRSCDLGEGCGDLVRGGVFSRTPEYRAPWTGTTRCSGSALENSRDSPTPRTFAPTGGKRANSSRSFSRLWAGSAQQPRPLPSCLRTNHQLRAGHGHKESLFDPGVPTSPFCCGALAGVARRTEANIGPGVTRGWETRRELSFPALSLALHRPPPANTGSPPDLRLWRATPCSRPRRVLAPASNAGPRLRRGLLLPVSHRS